MLNRLKAVFASFETHGCEYVVIGGVAAVLHGVPRATFDLDILIRPTLENCKRILIALETSGLGTAALVTPTELLAHEITVFQDRVRLDIQTSTPGLAFEDAWVHKLSMVYQDQSFLIASKRAAGRRIDLEDVHALESTESD